MAEKMTAVWLVLLTIIICSVVPVVMIVLTSGPITPTEMLLPFTSFIESTAKVS